MSKKSKVYDLKDVRRALRHIYEADDAVVIVIRGHILIDNFLRTCLDKYIRGGMAPFDNSRFDAKLKLAYAVGLVSDDEQPLFQAFNRLRNDLAHHLDAYVTKEDEHRIKQTIRDAGFLEGLGEGPQIYQMLVTLLFCILAIRLVDIGDTRAPVIAKSMDEAYWTRVSDTAVAPLLLASDDKTIGGLLIAGIIMAVLRSFSSTAKRQPPELGVDRDAFRKPHDADPFGNVMREESPSGYSPGPAR